MQFFMNNWYKKISNNKISLSASINNKDIPIIHAQLLLKKISENFPEEFKNK